MTREGKTERLSIKAPQGDAAGRPAMGLVGNRPFWVLCLSIVLRAVHLVGASVFLAGFLLEDLQEVPLLYTAVAAASGLALLATEAIRHRQIHREVAGLATLLKLVLLGAAYHGYAPATGTVLAAFILAAIGAHVPKKIRHRLLY